MGVVVTGSSGFIGQHLVSLLRSQGHQVIGLDRRPPPDDGPDRHVSCELSAPNAVAREALRRADAVVHLAGCPGVRDTGADVGHRRYRDNASALRQVLSLVPRRVPAVVASSSSVYGGSVAGRASAEHDVLAPRGGYARSKVLAEALCHEAASRGASVTVVRPFTVVGEGQRPDMALHRWVIAALAGQPLTVLGSLERTRDLTDVRDVARAFADLIESAPGGPVNLGSGRPVSLRQMVRAVGAVTGVVPVVRQAPAAREEVSDTLADTRRLVELTGRRPATDLLDVVARVRDDLDRRALPLKVAG